jgi:glycyl-tRNA synthetase (class II)
VARKLTLDFLKTEAGSGIILGLAAVAALLVANSAWSAGYFGWLKSEHVVQLGPLMLELTVSEWIKEDGTKDSRVVMRIPPNIAPTKLAILPLLKKDGLPEIARELMNECKESFMCFYEEKDAIGKRYRRMDAIGTPFCVTIDHQTKEDNTVTIRYRDTMQQERVKIETLKAMVLQAIV